MKIIDLIKKHPKNTPITDKRILYYLKRLGYIWDYSPWGYLESIRIKTKDSSNEVWGTIFEDRKANELVDAASITIDGKKYRQQQCKIDMLYDDARMRYTDWTFTFEGFKFSTKYIDGCFSPYLITC